MSVNQSINPEVVEGARVVIIDGGHNYDAFFQLDPELVGKAGTVIFTDRSYTIYQPDAGIQLDNGKAIQVELQHLQVIPAQLELPFDLIEEANVTKVVKPRVNYLYIVEDEDGVYGKTFDRDHARELKASYGGKKAGVIITAYAAVKEIR